MSSPIPKPSAAYRVVLDQKIPKRSALRFNLAIALLVWAIWLAFGGRAAIYHPVCGLENRANYGLRLSGGRRYQRRRGRDRIPIFTTLLHIAPRDARNFSLAIQSAGMGADSLSIPYLCIPIERRALLFAGIPGVFGVIFRAYFVAPLIPPVFVRRSFTVLLSSMGVALLLVNREKTVLRN